MKIIAQFRFNKPFSLLLFFLCLNKSVWLWRRTVECSINPIYFIIYTMNSGFLGEFLFLKGWFHFWILVMSLNVLFLQIYQFCNIKRVHWIVKVIRINNFFDWKFSIFDPLNINDYYIKKSGKQTKNANWATNSFVVEVIFLKS